MAIELVQGTFAFLKFRIETILPAINADIAVKVTSNPPPVFELVEGELPSAESPRIALSYQTNHPETVAHHQKIRAVTFRIMCLVTHQDGDTLSNYEMCRQVSSDHVTTLLDNDALMLTPKINAGDIATIRAIESQSGSTVTVWPKKLPDEKTLVHGWDVDYTAFFSLATA